jgi:large subunit ribosomal protein L22
MEEKMVKTVLKELHVAPRKVRLVADVVRGKNAQAAIAQLDTMSQRSTRPIIKLIQSAIAGAEKKEMNITNLIIRSIVVDHGPVFKRGLPRARGRATLIRKSTSHITLELVEKKEVVAPTFVIPEKPKKVKTPHGEKTRAPKRNKKVEEKKEESAKKGRGGFMKKVFRRKAV